MRHFSLTALVAAFLLATSAGLVKLSPTDCRWTLLAGGLEYPWLEWSSGLIAVYRREAKFTPDNDNDIGFRLDMSEPAKRKARLGGKYPSPKSLRPPLHLR